METDGPGALKPALQEVPQIDPARCTGCGRCVAACPLRLLTLDSAGHRKTARIRGSGQCTRCGCCLVSCPVRAITADDNG